MLLSLRVCDYFLILWQLLLLSKAGKNYFGLSLASERILPSSTLLRKRQLQNHSTVRLSSMLCFIFINSLWLSIFLQVKPLFLIGRNEKFFVPFRGKNCISELWGDLILSFIYGVLFLKIKHTTPHLSNRYYVSGPII